VHVIFVDFVQIVVDRFS